LPATSSRASKPRSTAPGAFTKPAVTATSSSRSLTVRDAAGGEPIDTTIAHINVISAANQSVTARAVIDNSARTLLPGTFVTAEVAVAEHDVPLAVKRAGLQSFRDFTVVYGQYGDEYGVRMLELGREFGDWAEVLGGRFRCS
jgi:cobalt-zinc-cadmium efflux system membrane fusion protein